MVRPASSDFWKAPQVSGRIFQLVENSLGDLGTKPKTITK